ncbi:MAG: hypothetical protein ACI4XS_01320 [Bacillus sp. (in: firmicutes)]
MQTASVASSMIPQQTAQNPNELKNGQMIYGKVLKIHSNQTAEISIGQNKVTALLDAPIALGERYWFQVQTTGEQTMLKVMPANGSNQSLKEMSLQLLQHFSLPQSKESLSLALFLVENQLPFSKEQFIQSLQWLTSSGNQANHMPLLKIMHNFSLPFSEYVFRSLASFHNEVPLQQLFKGLNSLLSAPGSETEASVKALLAQLLTTDAEKLGERGLQKLIISWLTADGSQKEQISSILRNVGFLPKDESFFLQQVMKQIGDSPILIQNPLIKQVISTLHQLQGNTAVPNIAQLNKSIQSSPSTGDSVLWNHLQKAVENFSGLAVSTTGKSAANESSLQTAYRQLARAIIAHAGSENSSSHLQLNRFMQLMHQAGQQTVSFEQSRANMAVMLGQVAEGELLQPLSREANLLMQQMLHSEINDFSVPKSSMIANEIRKLIKQFGLGFEHFLANADKGTAIKEADLMTLKPLLMQLINETQQLAVKEQAEQLLHKITAQQILSQSSGPLQHFITQIPMSFHGFYTEATMQWSGRKDENDQIDPSFCRVLFYLQLNNIRETIVDMVVQNRILKVTIINEHYKELKVSAGPLIEQAKDNLAKLGYQVSGFRFIPPSGYGAAVKSKTEVFDKAAPYSGLDIKI